MKSQIIISLVRTSIVRLFFLLVSRGNGATRTSIAKYVSCIYSGVYTTHIASRRRFRVYRRPDLNGTVYTYTVVPGDVVAALTICKVDSIKSCYLFGTRYFENCREKNANRTREKNHPTRIIFNKNVYYMCTVRDGRV